MSSKKSSSSSSSSSTRTSTRTSTRASTSTRDSIKQLAKALVLLVNQNYTVTTEGEHTMKISNAIELDSAKLEPKFRLLSHYVARESKKKINISDVHHFVDIQTASFLDPNILHIKTNAKTFNRVRRIEDNDIEESMNLEQIMNFNLDTNEITLQLREVKAPGTVEKSVYHYISKYILSKTDSGLKFVINPVTTEPHKIIQPIRRHTVFLRKLGDPNTGLNIYYFLNSKLEPSNKIIFGSPYADIKSKSDRLFEKFKIERKITDETRIVNKEDKYTYNSFKYLMNILKDEASFNQYRKMLNGWRKNYILWSKKHTISEIKPVETFEYKFEINPSRGSKDKLSNQMVKLLERLQPYDSKNIKLEKDDETVKKMTTIKATKRGEKDKQKIVLEKVNITKSVEFGIYPPYLVSDIIRQTNKNIEDGRIIYSGTIEWLPLSKYNINEFTSFIHNFKSACFEIISLLFHLKSKYDVSPRSTQAAAIKFNHSPIYAKTLWNPYEVEPHEIKSNIVRQLLTETTIGRTLEVTASRGVIPSQPPGSSNTMIPPEDLQLIPLDEPNYGQDKTDRVEDFDLQFANMVSPGSSKSKSVYSLAPNFNDFYEIFSKEYDIGELLPDYVEPKNLEMLNEDWEPIPGAKDVEPPEQSIWSNLAKLVSDGLTSILDPMTPEQEEEESKRIRKTEEEEARKREIAEGERRRIIKERQDRESTEETAEFFEDSDTIGKSTLDEISNDSSAIPTIKPKGEEIRKSKSRARRLAEEDRTVKAIVARAKSEIEKIESDAITYRYDAIMRSLENNPKRFNKLNLTYGDVEKIIKKAALGKIFSKYTNDDVVKFILDNQVDDKIKEIAKEEASFKKAFMDQSVLFKSTKSPKSPKPTNAPQIKKAPESEELLKILESLESTETTESPKSSESHKSTESNIKQKKKTVKSVTRDDINSYEQKYLKYKTKYLQLKKLLEEQKNDITIF
jgi:hypothetical protein